jgi:hypothetical protein
MREYQPHLFHHPDGKSDPDHETAQNANAMLRNLITAEQFFHNLQAMEPLVNQFSDEFRNAYYKELGMQLSRIWPVKSQYNQLVKLCNEHAKPEAKHEDDSNQGD